MPSETFYCPNCGHQLTKSAQAYVLGEMMSTKDARFLGLGEMADSVTCPNCGASIDAKKMVLGEYDTMSGRTSGWLGATTGIAAFAAIVFYFDLPWWVGVICGSVVALLVEGAWAKLHAKQQI
jgi:predicted RNA-binding Zn-ribbon protein involved in translation (DUF1610 family)